MFITSTLLYYNEACEEQRELFAELFPDGVEVTREICLKHAQRFDWNWASRYLLTTEQRDYFREAQLGAFGVYEDAIQPSHEDYRAVLWSDHYSPENAGIAFAAHKAVQRLEWAAYNEARAVAFADAVNQ